MAWGFILQGSSTPPRFSSLKCRIDYPFSSDRGSDNKVFQKCRKLRCQDSVPVLIRMASTTIVPCVKQFSELSLPRPKVTSMIEIKAWNTPALTNLDDGR